MPRPRSSWDAREDLGGPRAVGEHIVGRRAQRGFVLRDAGRRDRHHRGPDRKEAVALAVLLDRGERRVVPRRSWTLLANADAVSLCRCAVG